MTLATDEFIRRFLLHVLPHGLPPHPPLRPARQRRPRDNLARARELLAVPSPAPTRTERDTGTRRPAACLPMLRRTHADRRDVRTLRPTPRATTANLLTRKDSHAVIRHGMCGHAIAAVVRLRAEPWPDRQVQRRLRRRDCRRSSTVRSCTGER